VTGWERELLEEGVEGEDGPEVDYIQWPGDLACCFVYILAVRNRPTSRVFLTREAIGIKLPAVLQNLRLGARTNALLSCTPNCTPSCKLQG